MSDNQTITTREFNENHYELIFKVDNVKFHFVGCDSESAIYVVVFQNGYVHTWNHAIRNDMQNGYTADTFNTICKVWAADWLAF
jgi:hypothetical protein